MSPRVAAASALALVAIGWGAIPLLVRGDVPPSQLVAARLWLGALAVVGYLAATDRLRFPPRHRGRLIASGMLLGVHWAAFFVALTRVSVALTLAILYLGPLLAAVLAPRILGERVSPRVMAGLGLGLVGVVLVVQPERGADPLGLTAAAVSAVTLTALMLVAKPAAEELGGLVVTAGELSVAAALATPWAIEAVDNPPDVWARFMVLGVVFTGLAGVVYWTAMRHLPVATVGVIMYLEPASAVAWAALVLDEHPDPLAWAGVALVILGGVMAVTERAREEVMHAPAAL